LDVDGDGFIAPLDVLQVINHLNEALGEGEAASETRPGDELPQLALASDVPRPGTISKSSVARRTTRPLCGSREQLIARSRPICAKAIVLSELPLRSESKSTLDPQLVDRIMLDVV
jgi:hypothetical protein